MLMFFAEIINRLKMLNRFAKSSILHVSQSLKNSSGAINECKPEIAWACLLSRSLSKIEGGGVGRSNSNSGKKYPQFQLGTAPSTVNKF